MAATAPVVEAEVETLAAPMPAAAPAVPVVQVVDEEVPLAVLDVEDEVEADNGVAEAADNQELITVEDEETPLANTKLDIIENAHKCATHFGGMIVAAALSAYYVVSSKKRDKEITDLRKERDSKERR